MNKEWNQIARIYPKLLQQYSVLMVINFPFKRVCEHNNQCNKYVACNIITSNPNFTFFAVKVAVKPTSGLSRRESFQYLVKR